MPPAQLVVGTAGHIDHGKSRLVRALTGVDPDRLPEEKARGMTIDLGFAHAEIDGCDVWFVDVPGHERFIRNMVAGATGVDAALLVVAADDSIMPQTREHAELLAWLGVSRCVVVLSKMDLVDDEWAGQVEDEARQLLAALGVEPLACVRTSAETGRGLDELRNVLARLAQAPATTAAAAWFRMPIDRAFNVPGRGTVVTGSVAHGAVRPGDVLELWPAGRRVRVRGLQSRHERRDAADGRMRLALNLASVALDDVSRGCTLASPGYLEPARLFDVHLTHLRLAGRSRQRLRLRLHLATSELLAELRLPGRPDADAVRGVFAQLVAAEPLVAEWGQRFILRDEPGTRTLGGGVILQPSAGPWSARRRPALERLTTLRGGQPVERLEAAVRACEWRPSAAEPLAVRAGLRDAAHAARLARDLSSRGRILALPAGGGEAWLHGELVGEVAAFLEARLRAQLEANPRLPGVPLGEWPGWMPRACPAKLRPALAEALIAGGRFEVIGSHVLPRARPAEMPEADRALFDAMLAEFDASGFQTPALAELRCRTPANDKRLRELVQLALARGRLVRIAEGLWLHERRWRELVERVVSALSPRAGSGAVGAARGAPEGLTVAELRDLLGSTRKWVVPIAEALDAAGVTRRVGDRRVLAGGRLASGSGT